MKINKIMALLLGVLAFTACDDDANNWGIDETYNRLFRSTNFELIEEEPTSVMLSFKGVSGATKYVFEFSQGDSLLFDNIVNTCELLADTMTAYREEPSVVNTEYHMLFDELNGTTRYSVRMKAVDEVNGMESGYSQLTFVTPDEQIFTGVIPGTTKAQLKWEADKEATTIKYARLEGAAKKDTVWLEPHTLTTSERSAGTWTIEGLSIGTDYLAQIFNDDVRRGSYEFRTLGATGGTFIEVQPNDDINTLLQNASGDVTLSFTGGQTYVCNRLAVPATINNLYLAGNVIDGVLPTLKITAVDFVSQIESFNVQYMDVAGDNASFFMMLWSPIGFKHCVFEGCRIHDMQNSLVTVYCPNLHIDSFTLKNCIIERVSTGGWGVINCMSAGSLKNLTIVDCTFMNINDQLADVRVSVDEFQFKNVTFCNYLSGLPKLFLFNAQPKASTVSAIIFCGDLGGNKINSGNSNYAGWLNFSGCYLTSDFTVNKIPFTDAKILDLSTDELFVDPRNGDFHFRPEVKFEGDGKVGDPRWWSK